jgi:hypothetical protein
MDGLLKGVGVQARRGGQLSAPVRDLDDGALDFVDARQRVTMLR